jgi:hypothetical protein
LRIVWQELFDGHELSDGREPPAEYGITDGRELWEVQAFEYVVIFDLGGQAGVSQRSTVGPRWGALKRQALSNSIRGLGVGRCSGRPG